MNGKATVDFSVVWLSLRRVKDGQTEGAYLHDKQRSGRICIAVISFPMV
jgi:hypothetical protein